MTGGVTTAARERRIDPWRVAPAAITALFALVVLTWPPRSVALAAHQFRADLFGREGFTIWNGQWYGGHHTPAYSVLSPPLAWLLTPRLLLALAASVPAGFGDDGLPLAVQLVGPPNDEPTLLTLSAQIEKARPWADARPGL